MSHNVAWIHVEGVELHSWTWRLCNIDMSKSLHMDFHSCPPPPSLPPLPLPWRPSVFPAHQVLPGPHQAEVQASLLSLLHLALSRTLHLSCKWSSDDNDDWLWRQYRRRNICYVCHTPHLLFIYHSIGVLLWTCPTSLPPPSLGLPSVTESAVVRSIA